MRKSCEAWTEETSMTFSDLESLEDQRLKGLLGSGAKLLHRIEADTSEEALEPTHRKERSRRNVSELRKKAKDRSAEGTGQLSLRGGWLFLFGFGLIVRTWWKGAFRNCQDLFHGVAEKLERFRSFDHLRVGLHAFIMAQSA